MKIPKTFCITLADTPERTLHAQHRFDNLNLQVEFFYGIHAKNFGLKTVIPFNEDLPPSKWGTYFISQGSVGCILSHYMLWQTLTHMPYDEVLILEDDAYSKYENIHEKFDEITNKLPDSWNFVYIGSVGTDDKQQQQIQDEIHRVWYPYGTHAYMIKKTALSALIATNHSAWAPVDIQIGLKSLKHLEHYTVLPSLFGQLTQDSEPNKEIWKPSSMA